MAVSAGIAPARVEEDAAVHSMALRIGLLAALAALALWPTWTSLERFWREIHDYRHGYLVVVLVAGWFVAERHRLGALPDRPAPIVLPVLAVMLLAWLVAWKAHSQILMQLLWPVVAIAAIWAGAGRYAARAVLLPLSFLYFAIPVWDYLVPPLQWLTVEASRHFLALVQIPIAVDGNLITIPDGTFEVAEGCAGKRYFVVTLATAMAAGIMNRLPRGRFVVLMASAAAMALAMNWIRVLIIIVAGHLTAMQHYLVAVEHLTFGWVLFGLLVVGVVYLAHRLANGVPATEAIAIADRGPRVAFGMAWWPVVLLAGVAAMQWMGGPLAATATPPLQPFPLLTGAWQGPMPPTGDWRPIFTAPASELRAAYLGSAGRVEIYANVYGIQRPGQELVGFGNSIGGQGWSLGAHAGLAAGPLHDLSMPQYQQAMAPDGTRWVVGRVYRVGGSVIGRDVLAQIAYGFRALSRPIPAGVIAFATRCGDDCGTAQRVLEAFWADAAQTMLDIVPARYDGAVDFE